MTSLLGVVSRDIFLPTPLVASKTKNPITNSIDKMQNNSIIINYPFFLANLVIIIIICKGIPLFLNRRSSLT